MSDATGENPMHDDRDWIDAAARIWAPEPRSPAQRARFAATLAERRTRPGRLAWAPLGAFAAAAAVAVMLVVAGGQGERSDSSAAASVASGDVLVTLALDDAASVAAADESLPDDYVLLEEALGL